MSGNISDSDSGLVTTQSDTASSAHSLYSPKYAACTQTNQTLTPRDQQHTSTSLGNTPTWSETSPQYRSDPTSPSYSLRNPVDTPKSPPDWRQIHTQADAKFTLDSQNDKPFSVKNCTTNVSELNEADYISLDSDDDLLLDSEHSSGHSDSDVHGDTDNADLFHTEADSGGQQSSVAAPHVEQCDSKQNPSLSGNCSDSDKAPSTITISKAWEVPPLEGHQPANDCFYKTSQPTGDTAGTTLPKSKSTCTHSALKQVEVRTPSSSHTHTTTTQDKQYHSEGSIHTLIASVDSVSSPVTDLRQWLSRRNSGDLRHKLNKKRSTCQNEVNTQISEIETENFSQRKSICEDLKYNAELNRVRQVIVKEADSFLPRSQFIDSQQDGDIKISIPNTSGLSYPQNLACNTNLKCEDKNSSCNLEVCQEPPKSEDVSNILRKIRDKLAAEENKDFCQEGGQCMQGNGRQEMSGLNNERHELNNEKNELNIIMADKSNRDKNDRSSKGRSGSRKRTRTPSSTSKERSDSQKRARTPRSTSKERSDSQKRTRTPRSTSKERSDSQKRARTPRSTSKERSDSQKRARTPRSTSKERSDSQKRARTPSSRFQHSDRERNDRPQSPKRRRLSGNRVSSHHQDRSLQGRPQSLHSSRSKSDSAGTSGLSKPNLCPITQNEKTKEGPRGRAISELGTRYKPSPPARNHRNVDRSFETFKRTCFQSFSNPDDQCMFLAQNQDHVMHTLMEYHSEHHKIFDTLISLLHSALLGSSVLCDNSRQQLMSMLKRHAFFECSTIISIVKSLVSTMSHIPNENNITVANQLTDIMELMIKSHILPTEDSVIFLGSLQAALKTGKNREDATQLLIEKIQGIEFRTRQPLPSENDNSDDVFDADVKTGDLGPILPRTGDIQTKRCTGLVARKVVDPFPSAAEYIRYIFLSFREDFIGPLCKGIQDYIQHVTILTQNPHEQRKRFRSQEVRLYENVTIVDTVLSSDSEIGITIQIDTSRFRNLNSRLNYGSLVCLSCDGFQSIVYAFVSEKNIETLRTEGRLNIRILDIHGIESNGEEVSEGWHNSDEIEDCEMTDMGTRISGRWSGGEQYHTGRVRPTGEGDKAQVVLHNLQGRSITMLESTAFYTSYVHTLQSLKALHNRIAVRQSSLPFKKQLVEMNKEMPAPRCFEVSSGQVSFICMKKYADHLEYRQSMRERHLQLEQFQRDIDHKSQTLDSSHQNLNADRENDYRSVEQLEDQLKELRQELKKEENMLEEKYRHNHIDQPNTWPTATQLGVDESQYAALRLVLTHQVALVQGPPGTGKTKMGIRLAELLLQNEHLWREDANKLLKQSPLLLVSYTNHALDQFLTELLKLPVLSRDPHHHVVRVGSRSEEAALQQHNITSLRRNATFGMMWVRNQKGLLDDFRRLRNELDMKMQLYKSGIVHHDHLNFHDVISVSHCESLAGKAERETCRGMVNWLCLRIRDFGHSLNRHPSYIHYIPAVHGVNVPRGRKKNHKQDQTTKGQWKKQSNSAGLTTGSSADSSRQTIVHQEEETEDGEIIDVTDNEGKLTDGRGHGTAKDGVDQEMEKCEQEMDIELEHERKLELDISEDESELSMDEHQDALDKIKKSVFHETMAIEFHDIMVHYPDTSYNMISKVQQEINMDDIMTDEEADNVCDIWRLDIKQRWRLYRLWLRRLLVCVQNERLRQEREFGRVSKQLEDFRSVTDLGIMQRARVVAMTTTGAARCAAVLRELGSRLVVVEEAAQVSEAHLLACLSPACQHLIMIGDHQQLRPSYTNYDLTVGRGHHHIDISLFERLCRASVPFQRLNLQHRMRPEISSLLVPTIYEELNDHPSVLHYPNVTGVKVNVYFLDHNHPENTVEESQSKRNTHEAEFLASFYLYLRLQGYSEKDITVLALYKDQVLLLRTLIKKMEKDSRLPPPVQDLSYTEAHYRPGRFKPVACKPMGARVCAVDNFQGEESRIVLLSLVRSNRQGRIGYLKEPNRVCVALSRAKEGLFVIGNCSMLSKSSPHCWRPILDKAKQSGSLGDALELFCPRHDHVTPVTCSADIVEKCHDGGCNKRCDFRRECGHTCNRMCHVHDPDHIMPCTKPCVRECPSGHQCQGLCYQQPCPPCQQMCEKTCLVFGHPCQKTCGELCGLCQHPCERKLPCGHQCQSRCGKSCTTECYELEKVQGECGHEFQAACYLKQKGQASCTLPCQAILECLHLCAGKCGKCFAGRLHTACTKRCRRVLLCRHECLADCTQNCPPCRRSCEAKCVHSERSCNRQCGEECQRCLEPCVWCCKPACPNKLYCDKFCWEICDRPRCNTPCLRKNECQTCKKWYKCRGLLCENSCPPACPECNAETFNIFLGFEDDDDAVFYQMPDCKCVLEVQGLDQYMDMVHDSSSDHIGHKVCPKCSSPVLNALRYGNAIKEAHEDVQNAKKKMLATDPAQLRDQQYQLTTRFIRLELFRDFDHHIWVDKTVDRINKARTLRELTVPENQLNFFTAVEQLKQKLPGCSSSSSRSTAAEMFWQKLSGCSSSSSSSSGSYYAENREVSAKLSWYLERLETWITERRNNVFSQQQLTQFQTEMTRADLAVIFCVADSKLRERDHKNDEDKKMQETVQKYLERLLSKPEVLSEEEVVEMREHVDDLKGRYLSGLGITNEERIMIVKAMNFQKGHWYKCKNGHVYCIADCGGATEESRCPECGEGVGGKSHRLREDNAVATEMDGATYGAWSEQANLLNYQLE